MNKPGFVALAMKRTCTYTATCGHPNNCIRILSPAVMNFCQVINDLVETNRNKIGELHFHHAFVSFQTQSQCRPYNGTFTNGSVPHSRLSKRFHKAFGYFKSAAILCNFLSHQYPVVMLLHGLMTALFNSIDRPVVVSGQW